MSRMFASPEITRPPRPFFCVVSATLGPKTPANYKKNSKLHCWFSGPCNNLLTAACVFEIRRSPHPSRLGNHETNPQKTMILMNKKNDQIYIPKTLLSTSAWELASAPNAKSIHERVSSSVPAKIGVLLLTQSYLQFACSSFGSRIHHIDCWHRWCGDTPKSALVAPAWVCG